MTGGPADVAAVVTTCPSCGSPVVAGERFCETCGADLDGTADGPGEVSADGLTGSGPTAATAPGAPPAGPPGPVREGVVVVDADLTAVPGVCAACGGRVAPDGYCEECGTPVHRPRDHWADQPATWVAMACDRGIRHHRNEDAGAVAASSKGDYAVLVVCDGVSSSVDSDVASLAAARAARDVLAAVPPPGPDGGPAGDRTRTLEDAVRTAAAAAQREATAAARDPREPNPPSCTFVAAVLEAGTLVAGWVGDSRAYWLPDSPDAGPPEQLSVDDSWAAESMALGMSREEAESGPHAHAITRWLGVDAPDPVPRTMARRLDAAGWLLVCSDGLWNYCSAAPALHELVTATVAGPAGSDPRAVAEELVAWANRQGGQDNITVALARVG